MYRVAFLCSRFGGGGAEKHLLRILNEADFEQFDIYLLLTREGGGYELLLDRHVKVIHLTQGVRSSTKALILARKPLVKWLKANQPAALISFMDAQNVLSLSLPASLLASTKRIICCQNAPLHSLKNDGWRGRLIKILAAQWYPKADLLIAICKGVEKEITNWIPGLSNTRVIYNAGYDDQQLASQLTEAVAPEKRASVQLLSVGRLTHQKGFDILFQSLVYVKGDWHLWLLGTGPDREKLEQQAHSLNLDKRINFVGFEDNPYPHFQAADVFILSSRWEGFGNVITEAMACSTAVVAADCPYGPNEIIQHGRNGLLAKLKDPQDLANQINRVIGDPALRARLAKAGKERAKDFSSNTIGQQYFNAIIDTL